MYALNVDKKNKRILSATFKELATPEMVLVETLPEGSLNDYKYVNGRYVYDPLPTSLNYTEKILNLKKQLADTDYIVVKIIEGVATWEEYPNIKEKRQSWRNEINHFENLQKRINNGKE